MRFTTVDVADMTVEKWMVCVVDVVWCGHPTHKRAHKHMLPCPPEDVHNTAGS